jgi:hypothetical protein
MNRYTLFNILYKGNIPDPLLSALIKIYKHNEIEIRLENKMAQSVEINGRVRQGCPLSQILCNVHIKECFQNGTQTIYKAYN